MADNITFATDDVSSVIYPRVKLMLGADGSATADADGTTARGMYTDPRWLVTTVTSTPTVTASSAYTSGNAVGGLLTFSNAARASGKPIEIVGARILDKNANSTANSPYELYLFDRTFTADTDKTAFDPSDSDMANCHEVLAFATTDAYVTSNNTICRWAASRRAVMLLNGTDLFGQLVTRSTPTYGATSDLTVLLTIRQL